MATKKSGTAGDRSASTEVAPPPKRATKKADAAPGAADKVKPAKTAAKRAAPTKAAAAKSESPRKRAPKQVPTDVPETAIVVATPKSVFNATPVDLSLWHDGVAVLQLPSLERATLLPLPPGAVLDLRPINTSLVLAPNGQVARGEGDGELVITPANLTRAPQEDPVEIGVILTNDTDGYIDVYAVENKEASLIAGGIAPGTPWDGGKRLLGEVLVARSTFTGALLGMMAVGARQFGMALRTRQQTVSVNTDFRSRLDDALPLPSPLPDIGAVTVIGEARDRPKPESRDYIVISEHENLLRTQFNGRPKVVTRTVKIAGAKLIWSEADDSYGLMSYQGPGALEVEELEMYADHVVIGSPLRFPGTNVTIYARRLEFRGDGAIDTTPMPYLAPARSQYHDSDGRPADDQLRATCIAENGLPGQAGGDIGLFVDSLIVPPGDGTRFVARGGAGQRAEPGGRRAATMTTPATTPTATSTAPKALPSTGETVALITQDAIVGQFSAAFLEAKECWKWRWPGEVDWPSQVAHPYLTGANVVGEGSGVTDLVIVAHDDTMHDTNLFFLSSSGVERRHVQGQRPNDDDGNMSWAQGLRPAAIGRPGKGGDAYEGGQPGDGGAGGSVVTSLPLDLIAALCDTAGGAAGPETEAVPGGEPGSPNPAFAVMISVVKKAWIDSPRSPALLTAQQVSAEAGAPAGRARGQDGPSTAPRSEPQGWLRPEIVDALLACARDAFRNGHRDLARTLLEPYYALLQSDDVDEELQFRALSIAAIRDNICSNLDYYGNPAGWLPRMRLSSNFDLFQTLRVLAAKMLLYAQKGEQKYATLSDRREIARQTSAILADELDSRVEQLTRRIAELATARLALEKVSANAQAKQAEFDLLKKLTESEALQVVERQRIFRGVTKVIGGLMKASPVGQPYLGLGGDVATTVGEINFTDPAAIPKQIGDALGKVGTSTDNFLKTNADLIEGDQLKKLRAEMQRGQGPMDALTDQLAKVKGTTASLEKSVTARAKPIEAQWDTEREAELTWFKTELANVEAKLKAPSGPIPSTDTPEQQEAERKRLEAEYTRLEARLGAAEAATLTEQRAILSREVERYSEQVAAAKADAKLEAATKDAERVRSLTADRDKLEAFRVRTDQIDDELRAAKREDSDLKAREAIRKTASQDALKRLRSMSSGISTLGQAVATLGTPATTADADVQAFAQVLLKSKNRDEYQRVLRDFESLAKDQSKAMDVLKVAQQRITTNIADIAGNLVAQNGLSRQRQSLDGALDVRSMRYLQDMQARARDLMRWSMYNLVMSYRYEYLGDVDKELFNFDDVIERMKKLEAARPDAAHGVTVTPLTDAEVKGVDDAVMRDIFIAEAKKILEERQHRVGASMQNVATLRLSDAQLAQLRTSGQVTFNLVRDMHAGNFNWVDARIVDITLETFTIETTNPALSVRLVFRHSGESVILGRDKRTGAPTYYYFRAAPGDDPIEWGYSYNHATTETLTIKRIRKDAKDLESDAMLKKLLEPDPGAVSTASKLEFKEYSPGYFSDLTLRLSGGPKATAEITNISALQFSVTYSVKTELTN